MSTWNRKSQSPDQSSGTTFLRTPIIGCNAGDDLNGRTFEQALATITVNAAKILGVDERVGSLEAGKDGDVVTYDGAPFEYTTGCIVVIEGSVVSRERD